LGPDKFGTLNVVLSSVAIASCLVPLAADTIAMRELIARPEQQMAILGSQSSLRLLGSLSAALLATSTIVFLRSEVSSIWLIAILAGGSIVFQAFESIAVWFNTHLLARANILARLPALLITSLMRLVLIYCAAPLYAFVACIALEAGLTALGLVLAYRYLGEGILRWRLQMTKAHQLFKDSWPLLIAGISTILYIRVDVLMIGAMVNDFEVGIYSAATKIAEAWYFVPTIIAASVQPALLRLHKKDSESHAIRLGQLYALMAWLSVSIAICVSIAAPTIISLLFGATYERASPVLMIHIWAGIPVFLGVASSQFLIAENLTWISAYRTGLGLGTNVFLNLALIPQFGALGAALATVLSYLVASFSLLFFRDTRQQARKMISAFAPSELVNIVTSVRQQLWMRRDVEVN
jgi:polysaccharide transporter, PST family